MDFKFHNSRGEIRRYVGVEIEISRYNTKYKEQLKNYLAKWGGVLADDGSIEPDERDEGGHYDWNGRWIEPKVNRVWETAEIKTAPARGNAFIKQINGICSILKEADAKANDSCGLHVHVDARDFEPMDFVKTALLWNKIEDKMFDRVKANRRHGDYCNPWGNDIIDFDTKLERPTEAFMDLYNGKLSGDGDRYYSLNFCAYDEHGTLENRMHHGTVNANTIIKWATLNAKMLDFIKEKSVKDIKKVKSVTSISRYK